MKNLKPVLLEVNANPSMRIEHEQEVRVQMFFEHDVIQINRYFINSTVAELL